MVQINFPAQKTFKRFFTGATVATVGATLGLGIVPGLGMQAALAEYTSCDSEWSQQAITYLRNRTGFTPPFFFCYEIDNGATETDQFTFDAVDLSMGRNHAFVAECDSDCADVDIQVYNRNGRLVGEDVTSDSYAEVYVGNVVAGETYQVDITMYDCDASFCGVVVGTVPRR